MKTNLVLAALMMVSAAALADQKDVATMNALLDAGASIEGGMSKMYVGVSDIGCALYMQTGEVECHMIDQGIEAQGKRLEITGLKAEAIRKILQDNHAPADSGMGQVWTEAAGITCYEIQAGVADGDAADRTSCDIDIEQEKK